jgi:hypothetical protein
MPRGTRETRSTPQQVAAVRPICQATQLAGCFLAELKRQSVDAEGEYGERSIAE